jgi:hypothetical protein
MNENAPQRANLPEVLGASSFGGAAMAAITG